MNLPAKNQKDVELVLRLFSLFRKWESYEKPMLRYLNISMGENQSFSSERAISFKERFAEVTELVANTIDKPFRPRHVINSAVLEAVMITLMENPRIGTEQLQD
jgi:hypothetical protein